MTHPETMSGVLLTAHGGPEALVWSDAIPVPEPGPGEVLVRVLAAGVNNTDINTRLGCYSPAVTGATGEGVGDDGGWFGALRFPRIQGGDLCGRIVALGDGVRGLSVGQRVTTPLCQPEPTPDNPVALRVLGSEYDGAFAQFCVLPARHVHQVDDSPLSDAEIAAIPCSHGTALGMLDRAQVAAGQRVLVTGASGGVGLAAVQLATRIGARVTALSGAQKADVVKTMGADQVLPRDAALPEGHFDAVIDLVGGPAWGRLIKAIRPGGHLSVAGAIAGPIVEFDLRALYLSDITLHGCTYQPPQVFDRLLDWMRDGSLRPLVSQVYPLAEIARAQADFMAKTYPGKLVLVPPEILS